MIRLAVYDPMTGTILRIVGIPVGRDPQKQAGEGEAVLVLPDGVEVSAGTHRIEDGAVVPI